MIDLPIIHYPDEDTGFFLQLTTKEAKFFYSEFVKLIPERVSIFTEVIRETVAPDWSIDANSEQTIQKLFEWLLQNIEKRKLTPEELYQEKSSVPSHIRDWLNDWKFTEQTYSNIVYAGIVWGEIFRSYTLCEWQRIDRSKIDANYNQPCLVNPNNKKVAFNPIRIVRVMCSKFMDEEPLYEKELVRLHNLWLSGFKKL